MIEGVTSVLLILLGGWFLWWFFFTPAPPPRPHRRRLEGVGWSVCALASCSDGVRLTVDTDSGRRVCEFEKRPDTGELEQDILLHIMCARQPTDVSERLLATLRGAGLGTTANSSPSAGTQQGDNLDIQVPLFGRREDLGFEAIRIMRAIASVLEVPPDTTYLFQQQGHPDTTLVFRFAETGQRSPETRRKLQELMAIARKAAA